MTWCEINLALPGQVAKFATVEFIRWADGDEYAVIKLLKKQEQLLVHSTRVYNIGDDISPRKRLEANQAEEREV